MDLRQIETFVAVISAGSVTAAGHLLGKSQSAVTRTIQDLEESLGLLLFERNGPKITPTEHAFQLLAAAENVLHSVSQVERQAGAILSGEPRGLEIGATPPLAMGLVPIAMSRLETHSLARPLSIRNLSMAQVVEAVLAQTVDLGVVSLPLEHRGLDVHWIREAGCVAVLPEQSPLARHEILGLGQLDGTSIVTLQNNFRVRHRINHALALANCVPAAIIEATSSLTAMQLARANQGVALVEPVSAWGVPLRGVVVRPLDIHVPYFFGAVTLRGRPLPTGLKHFIEALEHAASEVVPDARRREPAELDTLLR